MKLKEVTTVSASSIDKFLTCPRKWWLRYVLGQRGPETEAMRHGTMVHDDIEKYYTEGSDLQSAEAVEARSKGLLPDKDRIIAVEAKAEDLGLKLHGLDFLGFLDLVYFDDDGQIAVIDWKTRSRFGYAPDAAELLDDIQATLYAWIAFEMMDRRDDIPHSDQVKFSHVNMIRVDGKSGRNSPRSMKVTTTFRRDRVYDWINGQCGTIAGAMRDLAAKDHPRKTKQDKGSCFKYGPCEYKKPIKALHGLDCHDIPYEPTANRAAAALTTDKKERSMGLADLMKNKKKSTKKEKTESVRPDTPEPEDSGDESEESSALDQAKSDFLDGKNGFDLVDYGLSHVDKREFVLWRNKITKAAQEEDAENEIPPVNPPDAAPEETPVDLEDQSVFDYDFTQIDGIGAKTAENVQAYLAEQGIEDLIDLIDHDLTKIGGIGKKEAEIKEAIKRERNWAPEGADEDSKESDHNQDDVMIAACKAYRKDEPKSLEAAIGRMTPETKADFDAWRADLDSADDAEDQEPEGVAAAGTKEDPIPPSNAPITLPRVLYIDCAPTKGASAASLDDLLTPAKNKICEILDTRYWSAANYAKGPKALVNVILEDPGFLYDHDHVVARSENEGMKNVLPEIRQFFDLVIEG